MARRPSPRLAHHRLRPHLALHHLGPRLGLRRLAARLGPRRFPSLELVQSPEHLIDLQIRGLGLAHGRSLLSSLNLPWLALVRGLHFGQLLQVGTPNQHHLPAFFESHLEPAARLVQPHCDAGAPVQVRRAFEAVHAHRSDEPQQRGRLRRRTGGQRRGGAECGRRRGQFCGGIADLLRILGDQGVRRHALCQQVGELIDARLCDHTEAHRLIEEIVEGVTSARCVIRRLDTLPASEGGGVKRGGRVRNQGIRCTGRRLGGHIIAEGGVQLQDERFDHLHFSDIEVGCPAQAGHALDLCQPSRSHHCLSAGDGGQLHDIPEQPARFNACLHAGRPDSATHGRWIKRLAYDARGQCCCRCARRGDGELLECMRIDTLIPSLQT
eukprot:1836244-Prymnesium_polylepis.1